MIPSNAEFNSFHIQYYYPSNNAVIKKCNFYTKCTFRYKRKVNVNSAQFIYDALTNISTHEAVLC